MAYPNVELFVQSFRFMWGEAQKIAPNEKKSRAEMSWAVARLCNHTDDEIENLKRAVYSFEGSYAYDCDQAVKDSINGHLREFLELGSEVKEEKESKSRFVLDEGRVQALAKRIYDENEILRKNNPQSILNDDRIPADRQKHLEDIAQYLRAARKWTAVHNTSYTGSYIHSGTSFHAMLEMARNSILTSHLEKYIRLNDFSDFSGRSKEELQELLPQIAENAYANTANFHPSKDVTALQAQNHKKEMVDSISEYLFRKFNVEPPELKASIKKGEGPPTLERSKSFISSKNQRLILKPNPQALNFTWSPTFPMPTFTNTILPSFLNPVSLVFRLPDIIFGTLARQINKLSTRVLNAVYPWNKEERSALLKPFARFVQWAASSISHGCKSLEVWTFLLAKAGSLKFINPSTISKAFDADQKASARGRYTIDPEQERGSSSDEVRSIGPSPSERIGSSLGSPTKGLNLKRRGSSPDVVRLPSASRPPGPSSRRSTATSVLPPIHRAVSGGGTSGGRRKAWQGPETQTSVDKKTKGTESDILKIHPEPAASSSSASGVSSVPPAKEPVSIFSRSAQSPGTSGTTDQANLTPPAPVESKFKSGQ